MNVLDVSSLNYEGLCGTVKDRIHQALKLAIEDYHLNIKQHEQLCIIFTALSAAIIDYGSRAGMSFDGLRSGILICIDAAEKMSKMDAAVRDGLMVPTKEKGST